MTECRDLGFYQDTHKYCQPIKLCLKKIKGYPGEVKGENIFCPLCNDWIGRVVPCMEICNERGDYLENKTEDKVLKSAPTFNRISKHGGFKFPRDIKKAINVCLFCQAKCQDGNIIDKIPPEDEINREELLNILFGE